MIMRKVTWRKIVLAASMVLLAGAAVSTMNLAIRQEQAPASDVTGAADTLVKRREGSITMYIERKLAEGKKANRLIHEKSPYLLQHAFNPVDWYPWGEQAFEKARKEQKPIFLSVGYSTCYWCHVMEREVFEDDSIAALMNQLVVSIKVDREERPDVDRVYMTALQGMTGTGGWPMSMFLTPDLVPFFGSTYLPPSSQYGRPGFPDVLTRIHEVWTNDRHQIDQITKEIDKYLKQSAEPQAKTTEVNKLALERGLDTFSKIYDGINGGFGGAPKFPRPVSFNFLFRYYSRTGDQRALDMSLTTLKRMADGGMHDHIGGGFHRYATDERWHVPHFEKMLYDQAQLVFSYLDANQITHEKFYADVARDALEYVLRSMTHPRGGFFSAQDAESATNPDQPEEKEEGAFYVWEKSEIDQTLTPEEAKLFDYMFDVRESGNVLYDPQHTFGGKNILYVAHSLEETAKMFDVPLDRVRDEMRSAREKLFQARENRPQPHLDDKILVSWNGLMISAFARAYQVLGEPRYLEAAKGASTFILKNLYNRGTGTLLHRYRDGDARFEANLQDYAFFIQGLLDLYEASLDIRWLNTAIELADQQQALFYDKSNGGLYDTSGKDKSILIRSKEWYDGAEPTGNSVAILNLLRLSQMIDKSEYRAAAEKSLAFFGEQIQNQPASVPQFLVALDFSLSKPKQIIIAGKDDGSDTRALLAEVHSRFIPNKILLLADGGEGQKTLSVYIPFLESVRMISGKATAYVCENYACDLPTSDQVVLGQQLEQTKEVR